MQKEHESNIDIKGTISHFIKNDEPELTQEEAIIKYGEDKKKKKSNQGSSDEENTEEQEHMKRVKQELLASLERVKDLEKKMYGEKNNSTKKDLKVDKQGGKGTQQKQIENDERNTQDTRIIDDNEKEL